MSTQPSSLPVVVIGAGPVGLAAAAHLHERGLPFVVLEAGDGAGRGGRGSGATCGCSRPGGTTSTPPPGTLLDRRRLDRAGPRALPTGGELIDGLPAAPRRPAGTQAARPLRRPGARPITRLGLDRVRTAGRDTDPVPDPPRRRRPSSSARAVIDASGTWRTPERPRRAPASPPTARPHAGRVHRARPARRARRGPRPVRRQAHPRRRRRALRRQHAARPGRAGRRGTRHAGHLGDPGRRPRPAPTAAATPTRCRPAARSAPGCARSSTPAGSDAHHRLLRAGDHRPSRPATCSR